MFVKAVFYNVRRGRNPLWSKGIAWWTDGPYSHVELWLDGPADKAVTYSSREGEGSRVTTLDLRENYDVITISDKPEDGENVLAYVRSLPHYSYDWIGLLGFMGPFKIHKGEDRFCSEICFEVLDKKGFIHAWTEKRWKVSPNELAYTLSQKYGEPTPVQVVDSKGVTK